MKVAIHKDVEELKEWVKSNNYICDINMQSEPMSVNNGYKIFNVEFSEEDPHADIPGTYNSIYTILNAKFKDNLKTVCIPVYKSEDEYNQIYDKIRCFVFNGYANILIMHTSEDIDVNPVSIIIVQDAFYTTRNNALQKLMSITEE